MEIPILIDTIFYLAIGILIDKFSKKSAFALLLSSCTILILCEFVFGIMDPSFTTDISCYIT